MPSDPSTSSGHRGLLRQAPSTGSGDALSPSKGRRQDGVRTGHPAPTLAEERALWKQGYSLVAGVDEVGRGPLAGPVVAAAVVLPQGPLPWLRQVRDSKELTPKQRQALSEKIKAACPIGVGVVPSQIIDSLGILTATRLAMVEAVRGLPTSPHYLLIDALSLPALAIPQKGIIRGDGLSLSIAAASIVAKVARDSLMEALDRMHPGYGFARHKGYGTAEHLARLRRLGPCPIHRFSFAPVRDCGALSSLSHEPLEGSKGG